MQVVAKYVGSFLNGNGGILVFGVSRTGELACTCACVCMYVCVCVVCVRVWCARGVRGSACLLAASLLSPIIA